MFSEIINYKSSLIKLTWQDDAPDPRLEVRQVSGIIYDKTFTKILIVKTKSGWVIPGGHPEKEEEYITTLKREVMEESGYSIHKIEYLGKVLVEEPDATYQQLRFIAQITNNNPQDLTHETYERKLIQFDKIFEYILWARGVVAGKMFKQAKTKIQNTN